MHFIADAEQWYTVSGTGVGLNKTFDGWENWLELNNNGSTEAVSVDFKAPASGNYTFTGTIWNQWGQESSGVVVNAWNSQIEVLHFDEKNPTPFSFTVPLDAGDVVSIWVADEYSWVSAYLMLDVIAE